MLTPDILAEIERDLADEPSPSSEDAVRCVASSDACAPLPTGKALVKEFVAALTRLRETGEPFTLYGITVEWPQVAHNRSALRVHTRRTTLCSWTGDLHYAVGVGGGSIDRIKYMANSLAFQVEYDRDLRARLLAEAKPGILSGTATHEAA